MTPALLGNQVAAEADCYRMGTRPRLQLGEEVSHVRLHRLLTQEEAMADLAVHQGLRDQLQHFDLTGRRLLFELPQGGCERNHLRVALTALRSHLVETTRMVYVAGQDFFALCSVHDPPGIGQPRIPREIAASPIQGSPFPRSPSGRFLALDGRWRVRSLLEPRIEDRLDPLRFGPTGLGFLLPVAGE